MILEPKDEDFDALADGIPRRFEERGILAQRLRKPFGGRRKP